MLGFLKKFIKEERTNFFTLKKTERYNEIPFIAGFCAGVPLLFAFLINRIDIAMPLALSAFIFLYMPAKTSVMFKMATILICAFGFSFAFLIGLLSSFDPIIHAITLGVFTVVVHWINLTYNRRPPGSFFFIMIATMAGAVPFNLNNLPEKLGYMSIGTVFTCMVALIYAFVRQDGKDNQVVTVDLTKTQKSDNIIDAVIIGVFVFISLIIGIVFEFKNSYWVAISCLAVMQGFSIFHIWQRGIYRLIGTFIGLGLCWLLLQFLHGPLYVIICIVVLQIIVEFLIVRHYAFAVIFITPLTILLGEVGKESLEFVNHLMLIRLIDIVVGSTIGVLGGFIIFNNRIRNLTHKILSKK